MICKPLNEPCLYHQRNSDAIAVWGMHAPSLHGKILHRCHQRRAWKSPRTSVCVCKRSTYWRHVTDCLKWLIWLAQRSRNLWFPLDSELLHNEQKETTTFLLSVRNQGSWLVILFRVVWTESLASTRAVFTQPPPRNKVMSCSFRAAQVIRFHILYF